MKSTAWDRLSERQQLKLARDVVARRRKAWMAANPNLLAISAAPHRTRGRGITFRLERGVVIRFYVRDKPPSRDAHDFERRVGKAGEIPATIAALYRQGRQKARVAVPTDVYHEAGCLHAGAQRFVFYGQTPDPSLWVKGSASCLLKVADFGDSQFLLGCNHVFCGSDASPTLQAVPGTIVQMGDDRINLGQPACVGNFPSGPDGYALDAALVDVSDQISALPTLLRSGRIKTLALTGQYPLTGTQLTILSPNGEKTATYDHPVDNITLPAQGYKNGSYDLKFRSLLSYTAPCQDGDSGSAVIDVAGTLFGMHFYGPSADQAVNGMSYAFHISDLVGGKNYHLHNDLTLA